MVCYQSHLVVFYKTDIFLAIFLRNVKTYHKTYLTSHLSTAGCWTQSELFPTAAAFWPSLSPVPSSEWVRLWLPR